MINRQKISYKNILFYLLGLYTVLPDYFKIVGQNSALILAMLILSIYYITRVNTKFQVPKATFIYCVIYLILGEITHLFHSEINQGLRIFFEYFLLFIVIVKLINSKEDIQKLISIIVGFAVFESITSYIHFFFDFNVFKLLQSANLPPYSLDAVTQYRMGMVRVEGSFGHAITYAIYISICACLCLYMYNSCKIKKYLVFYFMCVVSLIMSISRMPIIIFIVSQIIYLCSLNLKKAIKIFAKILITIIPLVLFLSILAPNFYSTVMSILGIVGDVFSETGLSGLTTYETDSAFTYRVEMIRVLPELISRNPLLGIGGSNYRSDSFYFLINGHKQTSIDNEYFHTLLLYGIIGLGSLIWQVFGPLVLDKKPIGEQHRENKLYLYKVLIVLIYAINLFSVAQMFEYRLIIVTFALFFADIKLRKKASCIL